MKFGLDVSCLYEKDNMDIIKHLPTVKKLGYSGVEIAISQNSDDYYRNLRAKIDENMLECTTGGGLTPDQNIYNENKQIVENGLNLLKYMIDKSHILGSKKLGGVIYSAWNERLLRSDRKLCAQNASQALKVACEYAKEKDVELCLEIINRYETDALNTLEQGRAIVDSVDCDNLKLHFDTFHANIEEKNIADEILKSEGYIGHIHFCDNDRSAPGNGHIDFESIFKAIKKIKYDDWIVLECFPVQIGEFSQYTATYRDVQKSGLETAQQGIDYIKKLYSKF